MLLCQNEAYYKSKCKILKDTWEKQDPSYNAGKILMSMVSRINLVEDDFAW